MISKDKEELKQNNEDEETKISLEENRTELKKKAFEELEKILNEQK